MFFLFFQPACCVHCRTATHTRRHNGLTVETIGAIARGKDTFDPRQ